MPIAFTRQVPDSLPDCVLTHLERDLIDVEFARVQHAAYENALRSLGIEVRSLPPLHELPDSVFIEDTAVVLNEVAMIGRLGPESRRREAARTAAVLAPLRRTRFVDAPGCLEGGDVVHFGRTLLVGISGRTNLSAIEQLDAVAGPLGYDVEPIPFFGCLHFKTACTALSHDTMLVNPEWVDPDMLPAHRVVEVAQGEAYAANALAIGDAVLVSAAFPRTRTQIERAGFRTIPLDVSELQKAEAGLTCMSLLL